MGQPGDDAATALVGGPLTFSDFTGVINHPELGTVLEASGVAASALNSMDFIAFDLNGTTGGFEGSNWTFDDGDGNSYSVSHGFGDLGLGILFNGV